LSSMFMANGDARSLKYFSNPLQQECIKISTE
jgi:hypothetical protein